MYCAKCGSALVEGAAFCGACGQRMGDAIAPATGAPGIAPPGASTISAAIAPAAPVAYAGFWLRFVALIIDGLLLGVVSQILIIPFVGMRGLRGFMAGPGMRADTFFVVVHGMARMLFLRAILNWLYYALMESSVHRATLGKMALGLQVTDLEGQRISFGRATGRHFAKIISGLTIGIGFLMAGFTKKKQALHDMIAGCLVIKKE